MMETEEESKSRCKYVLLVSARLATTVLLLVFLSVCVQLELKLLLLLLLLAVWTHTDKTQEAQLTQRLPAVERRRWRNVYHYSPFSTAFFISASLLSHPHRHHFL